MPAIALSILTLRLANNSENVITMLTDYTYNSYNATFHVYLKQDSFMNGRMSSLKTWMLLT